MGGLVSALVPLLTSSETLNLGTAGRGLGLSFLIGTQGCWENEWAHTCEMCQMILTTVSLGGTSSALSYACFSFNLPRTENIFFHAFFTSQPASHWEVPGSVLGAGGS